MATLCLKEMGKFLWEGREESLPCWLFQFRDWYYEKWVGRYASFSPRRSVNFWRDFLIWSNTVSAAAIQLTIILFVLIKSFSRLEFETC